MSGTISSRQKCPRCGKAYKASDGSTPISCCKTQPTKYVIKVHWHGNRTLSYDSDGRTIHHWQHALNLLGKIRSEIDQGTFDGEMYKAKSGTTFEAMWSRFKAKYEGSVGTHQKIDVIGRHHMVYFEGRQLRDLRNHHVDEWWTDLKNKGLSAHYRNDIHGWATKFFGWCFDMEALLKPLVMPNRVTVEKKRIAWLTPEQQGAVLDQLPEHDRPIYEWLFMVGCRVGEAQALHRADIDWDHETVDIQHTVKRDGSIGPTKSQRFRTVPLVPEIRDCLSRAMKISGLNPLVFTNKWGRMYSDDYLRDTFRKACEEAEVPVVPLKNATRHSWVMQRLAAGHDIYTVSQGVGHADVSVTTRSYSEAIEDHLKALYGTRTNRVHSKTAKLESRASKGSRRSE